MNVGKSSAKSALKNVETSLVLAVRVELPTLCEGQTYVFELTDYTEKKENNEVFISDPFYIPPQGYKMCVKVYANGTGSGTGSHFQLHCAFCMAHMMKT